MRQVRGTQVGEQLLSLQALRFVAAALVVYAHAVDAAIMAGARPLVAGTPFENFGAIGVDVFFVISGFIITRTAARAPDAKTFWRARLLRILPLYWLFSIPAAAIAIAHHGFEPAALLTTLLFWPVWGQFAAPYLTVGWSLSFEMLFYLCMGFTRLRLDPRWLLAAYAAACTANLLAPTPVLAFVGSPLIIEFLLGIAIARWGDARLAVPALFAALSWLVVTLVMGTGEISEVERIVTGELAWQRVLLWGVPSALLVCGATGLEPLCRGRLWLVLASLGDASYALYLSHRFVTYYGGKFAPMLGIGWDFTLPLLAIAVLTGWLAHVAVEQRLTRWNRAARRPAAASGHGLLRGATGLA